MRLFFLFLLSFASMVADLPVYKCPFLITGCARSGTTYMAAVLNRAGLKVGHEQLGVEGCIAWQLAADANYAFYNWNFPRGKLEFDKVLHLVRDPIKVIHSLYGRSLSPKNLSWDHAWRYVLNCCPEILRSDPIVVKCAKYWYYWNLLAESKSVATFRIEDLDERLDEFSQLIGCKIDPALLKTVPRDINHHPFPNNFKVSWGYLEKNLDPTFFRQLQELAASYGYPIEDLRVP